MSDPIGPRPPAELVTVTVRKEVAKFALLMEAKLKANDHKAHWSTVGFGYLIMRLRQEFRELQGAVDDAFAEVPTQALWPARAVVDIGKEAADVANFAMFIADNAGALK